MAREPIRKRRFVKQKILERSRKFILPSVLALAVIAVAAILGIRAMSVREPGHTSTTSTVPLSPSDVTPFSPTLPPESLPFHIDPVPPGSAVLSEFNLEKLAELGHFGEGWPAAVDYAPDGSLLAVGTSSGVELLSAADWHTVADYPFDSPVLTVRFSPDGTWLAAGQQDGTVLILNPASGMILQRLHGHARPVHGLAFSGWRRVQETPAMLASGAEDGSVVVWDLQIGMARYTFINPLLGYWGYGVRSLAFSPDDAVLVTGGDQGYVSRWDLATGEELPRLQTQYGLLFSIAFSPDGGRLATACGDGTVQLWDFSSEKPLALLQGHAYGAWSVTWTSDGKRLATGAGDGTVKLWNADLGTLVRENAAAFTKIDALQFSPDDSRLAAVSIGEKAFILDAQSLLETRAFPEFAGGIRSTDFFPTGEWAALGGESGIVYLWNLSEGEVIPLGNPRPASKADVSAMFSPNGGILASVDGLPGLLRLFDLDSLSLRSEIRLAGSRALSFSPDGKYLAAGGLGTLMVLDMGAGETRSVSIASRITSLAFLEAANTPEPLLAGGMEDGSILVWDLEDLSHPEVLSESGNSSVWSMAVSGSLLAAGDDRGDIRIFNMENRSVLRALSGYTGAVFGLTISPEGSLLAAGGIQGTIRFWSLKNGHLLQVLSAHNGWVNGLTFSPDGRWILSGGSDGVGRIWGIPA
jgi:WD40 repeat protein